MGQQITVTRKEATRPGVVVFELNRRVTGMGHERYHTPDITGVRPVDELARRLFAEGVKSVHVYSNVVTVEVEPDADTEHLAEVVRELFTYYREGVEVVDPMATPAATA